MIHEWYITILSDLQEFWGFELNHPLLFFSVVLFLFLLCVCVLASGISIAYDSRNEKKEREKRQLVRHQERCERKAV